MCNYLNVFQFSAVDELVRFCLSTGNACLPLLLSVLDSRCAPGNPGHSASEPSLSLPPRAVVAAKKVDHYIVRRPLDHQLPRRMAGQQSADSLWRFAFNAASPQRNGLPRRCSAGILSRRCTASRGICADCYSTAWRRYVNRARCHRQALQGWEGRDSYSTLKPNETVARLQQPTVSKFSNTAILSWMHRKFKS